MNITYDQNQYNILKVICCTSYGGDALLGKEKETFQFNQKETFFFNFFNLLLCVSGISVAAIIFKYERFLKIKKKEHMV